MKSKTPKYSSIHLWLRKNYGKAYKCEHCNSSKAKRYEYALIGGTEYDYNRDNFLMLCPSCHRKYDMTDDIKLNLSRGHKGQIPHNKYKSTYPRPIKQYSRSGKFMRTWLSLREIQDTLNINKNNICNTIRGRRETAGGYKWVV